VSFKKRQLSTTIDSQQWFHCVAYSRKVIGRNRFDDFMGIEGENIHVEETAEIFRFSGSELVDHLDCHHLTALDAAVTRDSLRQT
jgi:hypothetical protein